MERYLQQLLADIADATKSVELPYCEGELDLFDWISDEEEERTAPSRPLEEWTGILKAELPPAGRLTDDQVHRLLDALTAMLDAYNWAFVLQTQVPERIQYTAIRDNFDQEAKVKRWHMGFFEVCRPGTDHGACALGEEHCQCSFFAEFFAGFSDEELSPEEERARYLEIEITHLKNKYGDDWMKYYPYHLDPDYDDEYGNSHDYGLLGTDEDDDDDDDWWRK